MGWFFSGPEPKGGYSVFTEEVIPDDPRDVEVIDNACTLLAADELLGQAQHGWPPEVVEHVRANQGVADMAMIEKYAPITGHNSVEISCYEDGSLLLESERGAIELEADDHLIISYMTGHGRAHSICIAAEEFSSYAEQFEIRHIFTKR